MVFPLGRAMMLIGNDPQAGIRLENNEISQNHASIVYINGHYVIRDNGSGNGTFVNGQKTSQRKLAHNDEIRFGPYQFQVDMEGVELTQEIPRQQPSNLVRRGQEYRRSVILDQVKGTEAAGPVQIVMAGKRAPAPVRDNSALAFWGAGVLAVVAIIGIWGWLRIEELKTRVKEEVQKNAELTMLHAQSMADIRKTLSISEQRASALDADLAQTKIDLSRANTELTKTKSEFESFRGSSDAGKAKFMSESLRTATEELKKANEELKTVKQQYAALAEAKPKAPKPIPVLDPIKELPPLDYPPEVALMKDTQVPVMVGNKVSGSVKVPQGRVFTVTGSDKEDVLVNMDGATVRIAKSNTNFQTALDTANLARKQENERLHRERDLLITKLKQDAIASEQAESEKENFKKQKVSFSLRVSELLKEGVIGTTPQGVNAFLSGVDSSKLVVSETWKGDAYPMGVFKKANSDVRYRHYTADLDEFAAFKTAEAAGKESAPMVLEATTKELPKLTVDQMKEIVDSVNLLQAITDLKQMRKQNNKVISDSDARRFVREEAPKWKKAAESAVDFQKNYRADYPSREWLKKVAVAAEMCEVERLDSFESQLKQIDAEWLALRSRK